jgi:hypothetical protein
MKKRRIFGLTLSVDYKTGNHIARDVWKQIDEKWITAWRFENM